MDSDAATQLILLIILLALSAFFSSAETALTTVNKIRMRSLEDQGNKSARIVNKLIANPSKLLSAILIGNNIVNLTASSIATLFATRLFTNNGFGISVSTGVGIATGIVTILVLIFGEITPKTVAASYSEPISLAYARVVYALTVILTPVIFLMNRISSLFIRIFAKNAAPNKGMTENELLTIIDVSHEDGVIEREEHEMITNVVDFGDSLVKDVMVPRIDVFFVSGDTDYDKLVEIFREEKYSRVPVYEDSKDNVIGIVNLKDLFGYIGDKNAFSINDILRPPYFTYEYQKTAELMIQLRTQSLNIAVVLDEYGATAGLITLEDLLEEIVGEIRDEYDEEEVDLIQKVSDTEYMVDGAARLDDINDVLSTDFSSDDYDSIAGHILNLLAHIPEQGEQVETDDGIRLVVEAMDKNRIDKIHIFLPLPETETLTE